MIHWTSKILPIRPRMVSSTFQNVENLEFIRRTLALGLIHATSQRTDTIAASYDMPPRVESTLVHGLDLKSDLRSFVLSIRWFHRKNQLGCSGVVSTTEFWGKRLLSTPCFQQKVCIWWKMRKRQSCFRNGVCVTFDYMITKSNSSISSILRFRKYVNHSGRDREGERALNTLEKWWIGRQRLFDAANDHSKTPATIRLPPLNRQKEWIPTRGCSQRCFLILVAGDPYLRVNNGTREEIVGLYRRFP